MSGRSVRTLSIAPLVASTYFMVSGGPYGLEELLARAGYDNAFWVLLLTPLVWSLPTAFMVGELSGALPEAGGYYAWVRRALGPFWGFLEAWLSLIASIFDMAIYPTIFVLYLGRLFPSVAGGVPAVLVGAAMIAVCALWNLSGTRTVGGSSVLFGVILLAPFACMIFLSGIHPAAPVPRFAPADAGLLAGISIAMWNYMGWDNASTIAAEVKRPQRNYPLAMIISVILVTVTYLLPVWAARHAGLDPKGWLTGAWVKAAELVSGGWLGTAVVIGGMVSAIGAFNSLLLSYSQLPVVLAQDGSLPAAFAWRTRRTGAPWVAILVCSIAYSCCLGLGFGRLVLFDVLLYGLSLLLEFIALVVLRVREPNLPRAFRVPGGMVGAVVVGILPMALLAAAFLSSTATQPGPLAAGLGLAYLGPLMYWARLRSQRMAAPRT
jgi:amino acid transporter